MKHTTENLSATRAKVTVTLSGDETAAQDRAALRDVVKQAKVPGFRPGKAPEAIIRQRYAKQIEDERIRRCHSSAYEFARDKADLKVYALVEVKDAIVTPGEEAAPEFIFDLQPEFDLPNYEGIETKVKPVVVNDEDVEAEIENLRKSRASYNPVEREVQKGDYVKVSYKGTVDGKDIAEITDRKIWGTQENTWEEAVEVGPETLGVPAVIEGIVGMKAEDEKEVEQTFEDNHEVEELRGKTGSYKVTVHEVRERVLPEMDEEFLKSIQVESVEQLRERMKTEMTRRKTYERRMIQREQIARKLMDECVFEMPESAVEQETQEVLQHIIRENMQRGVPQEEFEKNKEELHKNASEVAALQTRRNFIVGAIAHKEKIEVTNEDLNRTIMNQAMRMRIRPEELVKELQKDRNALRLMQRDILLDKTMEVLADKATVVETEDAPESINQIASE